MTSIQIKSINLQLVVLQGDQLGEVIFISDRNNVGVRMEMYTEFSSILKPIIVIMHKSVFNRLKHDPNTKLDGVLTPLCDPKTNDRVYDYFVFQQVQINLMMQSKFYSVYPVKTLYPTDVIAESEYNLIQTNQF